MRAFKNKWFTRFAEKEGISDKSLCEAVKELEKGNAYAALGSGLYKQKVARPNQGKSSGYRCIIVYKSETNAFFLYGFPKNQKENLTPYELSEFKKSASIHLSLTQAQIDKMLKDQSLFEISPGP